MRLAVIADVHANHVALEATLERVSELGCDGILCLGDVVGYNAEPRACIQRLAHDVHLCVQGNHDQDVIRGNAAPLTHKAAEHAQAWTRAQLTASDRNWLDALPARIKTEEFVAVHGCFLNDTHVNGYVTDTMLEANLRAVRDRQGVEVAFCGHTHLPMAGWLRALRVTRVPLREPLEWPQGIDAIIINPGAVGQPRDGDSRASFALVDTESRRVTVHRVPYDVAAAQGKIAAAGLPAEFGVRLERGR